MTISKEAFYKIRRKTYEQNDFAADLRYAKSIRWIKKGQYLNIGEIGCKFAALRSQLDKGNFKYKYTGVDLDQQSIDEIEKKDGENYVVSNVDTDGLPFEDSSLDYIFAMEVMEHLEKPSTFLTDAFRALKPCGALIVSVPNCYYVTELIQNIRRQDDTEGHISSFNHININALCKFNGFKVSDRVGTYFNVPFATRISGKPILISNSGVFTCRSYIYYLTKNSK